jgi:hypothetical protein
MKNACLTVMAVLCVGLTGCQSIVKHPYSWSEYELTPGRVTAPAELGAGQEIQILKGKSDDSTKMLGSVGYHEYYGSEKDLTDGIAYQLSKELQKLKFVVKEPAAKSLEIALIRSGSAQATWTTAAILDFTVKFGNGKVKTYYVRNSSPSTVPRAFDGAVALAVMAILNDPEAISYIKE